VSLPLPPSEPLVRIDTGSTRPGPRLPEFLRKPAAHHGSALALKKDLRRLRLHTVCESARCPNLDECFHHGTATFLLLGNLCTRGCGFCSVPKAAPASGRFSLDPDEPANVARMAASMRLRHVVLTSVNRDDLDDGGSAHFAATVVAVRQALPGARIEVLVPDFLGDLEAVARVLDAGPDVFNHNLETVRRLYRRVRPQADYQRSLDVLAYARAYRPAALTKSGLMVGLGEFPAEVVEAMEHLRRAGVDIVTIGQYLQPTRRHLAVAAHILPEQYDEWRRQGLAMGFRMVFAGPFVRSSYMADLVSQTAQQGDPACSGNT
jgi:lipoic acid synthetase